MALLISKSTKNNPNFALMELNFKPNSLVNNYLGVLKSGISKYKKLLCSDQNDTLSALYKNILSQLEFKLDDKDKLNLFIYKKLIDNAEKFLADFFINPKNTLDKLIQNCLPEEIIIDEQLFVEKKRIFTKKTRKYLFI